MQSHVIHPNQTCCARLTLQIGGNVARQSQGQVLALTVLDVHMLPRPWCLTRLMDYRKSLRKIGIHELLYL